MSDQEGPITQAHKWAAPSPANGGGWYTHCESCTAWWAEPSKAPPTTPPGWMTTSCQITTSKIVEGVVYPPNVPSNTIDARPPKKNLPDLLANLEASMTAAKAARKAKG